MLPKHCLSPHVTNSIDSIGIVSTNGSVSDYPSVGNPNVCSNKIIIVGPLFRVFTTTGYVGNVSFEILPFLTSHPIDMSLRCKYMVRVQIHLQTFAFVSMESPALNHHLG